MIRMVRLTWYWLFLLLVIASCSSNHTNQEEGDFFSKREQVKKERRFTARMQAVDSLNLSGYGAYRGSIVRVDDQRIYVSASDLGMVVAINKRDPSSYYLIGNGKGQGPGEISGFSDFAVDEQHIVFPRPHRVITWSKSGALVQDMQVDPRVRRLRPLANDRFLIFSTLTMDYLFNILDGEGAVVRSFEKAGREASLSLKYEGRIDVDERYVYYAGYSESLIRKYTLEGELVYSVATIDNYPSELNYVTSEAGGNSVLMGYAQTALYATLGIAVYGTYLLVHPAPDRNQDVPDLLAFDVYDASDGKYLETYNLSGLPNSFAVDDDHIYTVETDRNFATGEIGDRYVMIYDNVLRDKQYGAAYQE